ncbi:MAG: M14 family zinc carboxypeptidase [bacterium]
MNIRWFVSLVYGTIIFVFLLNPISAQIRSPEEFLGFKVGEDKKLVGWETLVDYFEMLDSKSDRIHVQKLGKSTLGTPFIMAVISSPNNLLNLVKYKNLQKQAANPRHLSTNDVKLLARESKVVVMIALNIHSTEIASSQTAVELAYKLATENNSTFEKILDNVIILLIPSLNPDGVERVVDWYNQYLNTPHEGCFLPFLHNHYAGDDNNRDWFMMNLAETRLVSKQLYKEWFPQVVLDLHQTSAKSALLYLPPFSAPINPNLNPRLLDQINKYSQRMAENLQKQNIPGLATHAFSSDWWQGTAGMTPWWHNMMGFYSEIASAQMASPLFFPRGSLTDIKPQMPGYSNLLRHIKVWPGGWWRLRNVIKYELAVVFSLLELAAKEKEAIIFNFCRMNQDAIERGQTESPFAFVVPASQHDYLTTLDMIQILMKGGVEIHQPKEALSSGDIKIEREDFVILLSQPFRPYIKDLFERQKYTELIVSQKPLPFIPQDVTAWTLPLMMGINTRRIEHPFKADLIQIISQRYPKGSVTQIKKGNYLLSHKTNRSYIAVNRLLKAGKKVYWLKNGFSLEGNIFPPGTIYIPFKEMKLRKMDFLAQELNLEIKQTSKSFQGQEVYRLKDFRLGLYQPWTANIDEGWTRFILDKYDFPYKSIHNSDIKKGNLSSDFDVIILPDMAAKDILHGKKFDRPNMYIPPLPPPYQDGITESGVVSLNDFVVKGGTLIVLNKACDFAVETFGLPAENIVRGLNEQEYFCPGALVEIEVDTSEPIAFGMPRKVAAMLKDSPVFRALPWHRRTGVVANYAAHNPLMSGLMIGAEKLSGLPAILDIPVGEGRIILIGFKAQHRAQTTATFKFLFNAIYLSSAEREILKK